MSVGCNINVKGGIGIWFQLEKSQTEKEARKSLKSDKEMFEDHDFLYERKSPKFPKFPKNDFWDEAYFSEFNEPIMLLRRKRTYITIFCDDKKLCPQIERKLRDVSILKEY